MSSESRRAQTAALLARIEDVVSGHEQQRSGGAPGDYETFVLPELRAASFARQIQPLMERMGVVMQDLSRRIGLTGDAFIAFMEQVARDEKLPPVPAKAAHRRRFSR